MLFKQAEELGATTVSAFTDRVTHLVANEHGGEKYQVCSLKIITCSYYSLSVFLVCSTAENTHLTLCLGHPEPPHVVEW
jgi:twin BRCT domain